MIEAFLKSKKYRKYHNLICLVSIHFLMISCTNKEFIPAIVLTFDDDHVESWYANKSVFNKYNAKVTFFITRPYKLSNTQIDMLLQLQAEGHEIACHTLNHFNAINFIDSIGIEGYLKQEVDSCLKVLKSQGFNIYSFAYPFGSTNQELIDSLKTRFSFQRGSIYNKTNILYRKKRPLSEWNNIYITSGNQFYSQAMGIDEIYKNSMTLIKPGIDRCKKDSIALLLYAHEIVVNTQKNYRIDINKLDSILSYADEIGVKFLRCQDIH